MWWGEKDGRGGRWGREEWGRGWGSGRENKCCCQQSSYTNWLSILYKTHKLFVLIFQRLVLLVQLLGEGNQLCVSLPEFLQFLLCLFVDLALSVPLVSHLLTLHKGVCIFSAIHYNYSSILHWCEKLGHLGK